MAVTSIDWTAVELAGAFAGGIVVGIFAAVHIVRSLSILFAGRGRSAGTSFTSGERRRRSGRAPDPDD